MLWGKFAVAQERTQGFHHICMRACMQLDRHTGRQTHKRTHLHPHAHTHKSIQVTLITDSSYTLYFVCCVWMISFFITTVCAFVWCDLYFSLLSVCFVCLMCVWMRELWCDIWVSFVILNPTLKSLLYSQDMGFFDKHSSGEIVGALSGMRACVCIHSNIHSHTRTLAHACMTPLSHPTHTCWRTPENSYPRTGDVMAVQAAVVNQVSMLFLSEPTQGTYFWRGRVHCTLCVGVREGCKPCVCCCWIGW